MKHKGDKEAEVQRSYVTCWGIMSVSECQRRGASPYTVDASVLNSSAVLPGVSQSELEEWRGETGAMSLGGC